MWVCLLLMLFLKQRLSMSNNRIDDYPYQLYWYLSYLSIIMILLNNCDVTCSGERVQCVDAVTIPRNVSQQGPHLGPLPLPPSSPLTTPTPTRDYHHSRLKILGLYIHFIKSKYMLLRMRECFRFCFVGVSACWPHSISNHFLCLTRSDIELNHFFFFLASYVKG